MDYKEFARGKTSYHIYERGRSMYNLGLAELINFDYDKQIANYLVESSQGGFHYNVEINGFQNDNIRLSCNCPYDWGSLCKHQVAVLLDLKEVLRGKLNTKDTESKDKLIKKDIKFPQENQTITFHSISNTFVDSHSILTNVKKLYGYILSLENNWSFIETIDGNSLSFKIFDNGKNLDVSFQRIDKKSLVTSCNCGNEDKLLCDHKLAVFWYIKSNLLTPKFFDQFQKIPKLINDALNEFGFQGNIQECLKIFDFSYREGKIKLVPKGGGLVKSNFFQGLLSPSQFSVHDIALKKSPLSEKEQKDHYGVGYMFSCGYSGHYFLNEKFVFAAIGGKMNVQKTQIKSKIDFLPEVREKYDITLDDQDRMLLYKSMELHPNDVLKHLMLRHRSSQFNDANYYAQDVDNDYSEYGLDDDDYYDDEDYYDEDDHYYGEEGYYNDDDDDDDKRHHSYLENKKDAEKKVMWARYIHSIIKPLVPELKNKLVYLYTGDSYLSFKLTSRNLEKIQISDASVDLIMEATISEGNLNLHAVLKFDKHKVSASQISDTNAVYFVYKQKLYFWPIAEMFFALEPFWESSDISIFLNNPQEQIKDVVQSLSPYFKFVFKGKEPYKKVSPKEKTKKIYADGYDDVLKFTPKVSYDGYEVALFSPSLVFDNKNDHQIEREVKFEANFKEKLKNTHERFASLANAEGSFYFSVKEILHGMLFLEIFEKLSENNIEVYGMESIANFQYNKNKPKFNFSISSGIDWFDLTLTCNFGDQEVSTKELVTAIKKGENYIRLKDGTLGILPEEWAKKYSQIVRLSKSDKDGFKVSKFHTHVLDEMFEGIDDLDIPDEIIEKKKRLKEFDKINKKPLPKNIKATLRPYQEESFHWLHFLNDFKWGGILADDMGLGKTLQIITFLSSIKKQVNKPHLVVVPTTLVFNWQNEIDKFCPELKHLIYTGINRNNLLEKFNKHDIVITTYGIMTLDIEKLKDVEFAYVILDESHAIKNTSSLRYKASRLLNAENRIAMTGTPVENNTLDLYAQMNFLNPGILLSEKAFKENYVTPIDKKEDDGRLTELTGIVKPFILRRTKEEVATDLPEKTETILFCEMEKDQRAVYDRYKEEYRKKILGRIETDGLKKSGIYILEGLLKLRQICNDASLVEKTKRKKDVSSIKLKELMHNLNEKTRDHKVLVFSQFTGMLAIVSKELEKQGISYSYLDGKTRKREEVVNEFMTDPEKRVFLISLKAGGVGINLTEADYVFLIDPWWNPAIENQAVDRTHRIGQSKKVFAYKMICKNTIEEKILQLQEKKKKLAKELIQAEKGFVSNLSKADISKLFE